MMAYLGIFAGFCTSISFIPQALHIIGTRQTQDISKATYAIYLTGITLWIIYGLYRQDAAIWMTNIVSFFPALIIFTMKLKENQGK